MRILFLSFLLVQVILAVEEQAAPPQPDRQPFVMEAEQTKKEDTTGRVWGEPISEAEKLRARGIPSAPPTEEEMEKVFKALETEMRRDGRSIQRDLKYRWPNGRVPYKLDSAFDTDQRAVITKSFDNVEANTCITFEPFEETDEDWMEIFTTGAKGCFANARFMEGFGKHEVGLEVTEYSNCVTQGVVVHELLHILGVAHEQQRPDRDQHVTMHWENIQVDKASNMWRDSWETEDVPNLKKCSAEGVQQAQADFSDCVSGDTVTDFGVGYDFKSVMHYSLKSFAVNRSLNVMTPKDSSITDVGNNELSVMDIEKLNYAYYCQGKTKAKCGGSIYSPTGGDIDGKVLPDQTTCETILKTDNGKGVELSLTTNFVGTCDEDYLEVRIGEKDGFLIGKYCKGQDIPATLQIPTNRLFMVWKNTKESTMSGTWKAYTIPACCDKVFWDGQFWDKQSDKSDGRDVYKSPGGRFMSWTKKYKKWKITAQISDDSMYAKNEINYFCPGSLTTGWVQWNGNAWVPAGGARCSDCAKFPQYDECKTCCDTVITSIPNRSDLSGKWTKLSTDNNGRAAYQHEKGRYLTFTTRGVWGVVDGLDQTGTYAKNQNDEFCPSDLKSGWSYFDGSKDVVSEGTARCSDCDKYPQYEECAICCDTLTSTSTNPATLTDFASYLGTWSLFTTPESNGKKVYQLDSNPSKCLYAKATGNWMIGGCSDLASGSGWAFGDDAKCARKSAGWSVAVTGGLTPDATFKFTCENPPVPTAKATTTAKPPTKPDTTPKPPTKPPTKPETTTGTSVACEDCKNVLDGDMQGLYKLIKSGDPLCEDGCVYGKDGKVFCFVAGNQRVSLQCPAPTLF